MPSEVQPFAITAAPLVSTLPWILPLFGSVKGAIFIRSRASDGQDIAVRVPKRAAKGLSPAASYVLELERMKMTCPRVLLADDNPEVRYKVLQLLESDFDIVGSVDDGQQAIHSALRLNPDILVTDISMPLANGFQVASQLRHSGSTTKVIVLTVQDDHDYVEAAFSNGAFGYVLKPRIATDLIPAIQGALEGRRVASGTMRSKVSLVEGEPPPQLVTRGRNSLARCGSSRKSDRRLDKHSARRRTLHR